MEERPRRRPVLAALAAASVGGCVTGDGGGDGESPTGEEPTTDATGGEATSTTDSTTTDSVRTETETPTASTGTTPPATDLDLREANVTAVGVSPTDDGIRFDVTLYHDDDGEDGYADWWAIETLDGTELGRRDLAHPHCTCEFTRAGTFQIPDDVNCVVVRGHDQTHGYGGRMAIVTFEPSDITFVDQGPEPIYYTDAECPAQ